MADMQGALRYDRELAADAADPLSHFSRMIAPGEVVLDLGCGPGVLGRMTQAISACTFEGVEIDEEAALRAETSDIEGVSAFEIHGDIVSQPP